MIRKLKKRKKKKKYKRKHIFFVKMTCHPEIKEYSIRKLKKKKNKNTKNTKKYNKRKQILEK